MQYDIISPAPVSPTPTKQTLATPAPAKTTAAEISTKFIQSNFFYPAPATSAATEPSPATPAPAKPAPATLSGIVVFLQYDATHVNVVYYHH